MRDVEMHAMAALGATLLSAALAVPTVWFTDARAQTGPVLENMESIEAALAYKKPNAPKQPQKQRQAPSPEVKPQGVSRDEHKKVDDTKPKAEDKPAKITDPLAQFRRTQDDDADVGDPTQAIGAFDGSEFGMGDETKGDPYFQRLVVDLAWTSPELAKAGATPPVGCIQLTKDGKIPQITFEKEGDGDLQPLAEAALKGLKKKRNDDPEPVPTHLLRQLTTRWVCFKFSVQS